MIDPITYSNIKNIRALQRIKTNYEQPFYMTAEAVKQVVTDMDHYPYTRFFRGVPESSTPVAFAREAGFRLRDDECYRNQTPPLVFEHPMCWQPPCSTVLPCKGSPAKKTCTGNIVVPP